MGVVIHDPPIRPIAVYEKGTCEICDRVNIKVGEMEIYGEAMKMCVRCIHDFGCYTISPPRGQSGVTNI